MGKLCSLRATNVTSTGEGSQGRQGTGLPHLRVGLAMHELQELNGELDVAQAAGPKLELHIHLVSWDVRGHSLAHALYRLDEVLPAGAIPHLGRQSLNVLSSKITISGQRPGLQQSLELPALGPPIVISQVRPERTHKGSILSFRAKIRVDLPEFRLNG